MLFQTFMSVSFLGPSKNVNILDSKKLLYPTSSSYHHFIPQFSILFYHPLHFLIGQTTSMEQLYPEVSFYLLSTVTTQCLKVLQKRIVITNLFL